MMAFFQGNLKWENQSFRDLVASLDFDIAELYRQVSMMELAAFISWVETHGYDLAAWNKMTSEQHAGCKVKNPEAFLKSKPSWAKEFEKIAPKNRNPKQGHVDDMPDWMQKAWHEYFLWQHCEKVEDLLLSPYQAEPMAWGVRTNQGQIFHMWVAICFKFFGEQWPLHIALIDGMSEAHDERLILHPKAKLVCCLLHTDLHWACFFYQYGAPYAWISDGMTDSQIKDAAVAVLLQCSGSYWFQSDPGVQVPSVAHMLVPKQTDDWSCGHRTMLSLLHVLQHYKNHASLPDTIPEEEMDDDAIRTLIANARVNGCEDEVNQLQAEELAPPVHSENHGAVSVKPEQTTPQPSASVSSPARPTNPSGVVTPPEPAEAVTPVHGRKRFRENRADVDLKSPKDPKPRNPEKVSRKSKALRLQKAKEIMEANGFDHNKGFQIPHYNAKKPPPARHWKDFCSNLADSSLGKCSICNDLLRELWKKEGQSNIEALSPVIPPVAQDDSGIVPAQDGQDLDPQVVPAEDVDSQVVPAEDVQPPAKRLRVQRGRCPKDEARRDVDEFVASERPGIYTRLNETDNRHPFWCEVCGVRVLAQRKHDPRYLIQHEQRDRHKQGLKAMKGKQEHPELALAIHDKGSSDGDGQCECKGLDVENRDVKVSQFAESCWNLYSHGSPGPRTLEGEKVDGYFLHLVERSQTLCIQSSLIHFEIFETLVSKKFETGPFEQTLLKIS